MAGPWPMAHGPWPRLPPPSRSPRALTLRLDLFHSPPFYPPPIAAVPSSAFCRGHCFLDVGIVAWLEASKVVVLNRLTCERMKHVLKIIVLLVAISAFWIGLLETSVVPRSYTWLLPIYLIVSLGCYGLLMVGIGLMLFPMCPQEALLLQKSLNQACRPGGTEPDAHQDISEAKEFLKNKGIDVGTN